MNSSFSAISGNTWTRKWGGTSNSVDPYISGYFFTYWAYVPEALVSANINIGKFGSEISSTREVKSILQSSCLSVTIPGGTMNRAEFTGLGGTKWSAPTNSEYDNTVTFKFLEFSSLPILAVIHGWNRLIRDYRTGISRALEGKYTKQNYAATCYYWTTRPDGLSIEYFNCMTGLFPLKDPQDQYGGDLTSYDKLELDIDFNVDWMYVEDWVRTKCEQWTSSFRPTSISQSESALNDGGGTE